MESTTRAVISIIDKMAGRAEAEREYARKRYPEFFNEINERIDCFISYLKELKLNEVRDLEGGL